MNGAAPESTDPVLRAALLKGLDALQLDTDVHCVDQLLAFVALLQKWNRAYNLTAVRDPLSMVRRHLLDSLSISEHIRGTQLLDVGSGAGLPGIPLALCQPQRHFTLLDGNGKKTRFLFQARAALQLANVDVVHARIEAHRDSRYDCILSRAFAPLETIYRLCAPLLVPGGSLLAMKGALTEEEMAPLRKQPVDILCVPLQVPGLDEQRTLVTLQPQVAVAAGCGD